MTITIQSIALDVSYDIHSGMKSNDHLQPDTPDEVEVTEVFLKGGSDNLIELMATIDWLPEIEKQIIENL